jgi:general secretion pathway protein D
MKKSVLLRLSLSILLMFSLLSPAAVLAAGDGNKHFREGLKHEAAELWDKAAEEYALAVADNPKNPEYRLHLQRALFNASQMYMKRGAMAAKEGDYEGGYNAFRKAYSFDPTNELAKTEMERMIRLQQGSTDTEKKDDSVGKVKLVQTGYNAQRPADMPVPQKLEKLRDVPFPSGVDLQFIVKELARDLDLNVLFDNEARFDGRKVKIDLKQVSSAKALDYIFLQENLFFQKVGPRTILVSVNNRRTNFQQLVLRTFYLANASPKDVQAVIQSAIPAQPGRSQTIVLKDDSTNSITVRDTEENIRLISKLISSLDKDRAEVVMDVAIYEVNKNDLLQFGNQLGTDKTLANLGGFGFPIVHQGTTQSITSGIANILGSSSIAFGLPVTSIAALQTKNNTKLIASTQIHAFNNEDSSARIGQRVPVKTASFVTAANTSNNGVVSDVINYEQVGLTLKFKPIVFPNQDVQVAMEIESKDVSGALTTTPVFTERTIKGTARVQNNKTLLLASVAQNTESRGRQGLPLLGLIPIIGRLFTAPTRDNRQVDIVIAVTPRVIRAPAILPEDEVERPTGSLGQPTSGSLEAMIIQEEQEELLAAARRVPNTASVQLPDKKNDAPVYVRSNDTQSSATSTPSTTSPAAAPASTDAQAQVLPGLKPIDTGVKTLQINQTSDTSTAAPEPAAADVPQPATANSPTAELSMPAMTAMKLGQTMKIPVSVRSASAFRSAVLGLKFDSSKLAVRSVTFGDVFGADVAGQAATPFLNQNGKMFVSLSMAKGEAPISSGILAYVEIEALADGVPQITLEKDVLNFLTAEGRNFQVRF